MKAGAVNYKEKNKAIYVKLWSYLVTEEHKDAKLFGQSIIGELNRSGNPVFKLIAKVAKNRVYEAVGQAYNTASDIIAQATYEKHLDNYDLGIYLTDDSEYEKFVDLLQVNWKKLSEHGDKDDFINNTLQDIKQEREDIRQEKEDIQKKEQYKKLLEILREKFVNLDVMVICGYIPAVFDILSTDITDDLKVKLNRFMDHDNPDIEKYVINLEIFKQIYNKKAKEQLFGLPFEIVIQYSKCFLSFETKNSGKASNKANQIKELYLECLNNMISDNQMRLKFEKDCNIILFDHLQNNSLSSTSYDHIEKQILEVAEKYQMKNDSFYIIHRLTKLQNKSFNGVDLGYNFVEAFSFEYKRAKDLPQNQNKDFSSILHNLKNRLKSIDSNLKPTQIKSQLVQVFNNFCYEVNDYEKVIIFPIISDYLKKIPSIELNTQVVEKFVSEIRVAFNTLIIGITEESVKVAFKTKCNELLSKKIANNGFFNENGNLVNTDSIKNEFEAIKLELLEDKLKSRPLPTLQPKPNRSQSLVKPREGVRTDVQPLVTKTDLTSESTSRRRADTVKTTQTQKLTANTESSLIKQIAIISNVNNREEFEKFLSQDNFKLNTKTYNAADITKIYGFINLLTTLGFVDSNKSMFKLQEVTQVAKMQITSFIQNQFGIICETSKVK